jgi:hypothetical protein
LTFRFWLLAAELIGDLDLVVAAAFSHDRVEIPGRSRWVREQEVANFVVALLRMREIERGRRGFGRLGTALSGIPAHRESALGLLPAARASDGENTDSTAVTHSTTPVAVDRSALCAMPRAVAR